MKKALLAIFLIFAVSTPAVAEKNTTTPTAKKGDPKITGVNKEWNVDVALIQKLAKKNKCKEVVMFREVLPFFGRETTLKASKEINIQFEKEDLASGRAMILHEKSKCDDLLGNFLVMCTTDTALCYFEQPKTADNDKKKLKRKTN